MIRNLDLTIKKREMLNHLGFRCKLFRVALGITQKQVAEELSETQNNICCFENGKNNSAYILMWYINKGLKL